MTLFLAVLAALGSLIFGSRSEPTPAAAQTTEVAPAAELIVLDLVIDLDGVGRELDPAEQRALLAKAERVLQKRLPQVKTYPADDQKTGKPYLRLRAPEAAGFTRERLIERATAAGAFSFQAVALKTDLPLDETTLEAERVRVKTWRVENPDAPISRFALIPVDRGGPHPSIRWAWKRAQDGSSKRDLVPLLRQEDAEWRFGTEDMRSFHATVDQSGFPALAFDLREDRRAAFKAFTADFEGRQVAVAVGDRVLVAPVVAAPLENGGVVTGGSFGFTEDEVADLVTVLRNPLPDVPLIVAPGSPK